MALFFPTAAAIERAAELQRRVVIDEIKSDTDGDPERARIASIHARQDMILIVSLMQDQHRQMVNVSRGIWACAFLLLTISATLAH